MPMWKNLHKKRFGREERREERASPKLRMCHQAITKQTEDAWYVEASSLCGLAFDGGQMPITDAPSVQKLRRSRNLGLSKMADVFREFLGRRGYNIQKGLNVGPYQQRWELRTRKFSMGEHEGPKQQQEVECSHKHTVGTNDNIASVQGFWNRSSHSLLQTLNELAERKDVHQTRCNEQRVFDILNAGPRQRFVVKGNGGPFIVHNCVQAIARDIFCHGMKNVEAAGYPIVLHTHDEMISEVPIGYGSIEEYEQLMTDAPDWCADWPIRADGGWRGRRYRKD